MDSKSISKIILPILMGLGIISFWELFSRLFAIPEIVLPSPYLIFIALREHFSYLWYHAGVTLIEATLGIGASLVFAVGLAVSFISSKTTQTIIYPYAVALKATPIIALSPLLILWFGNGLAPKIIIASLIAFFPILVNTVKGLGALDEDTTKLLQVLGATKKQVFFKQRIPTALPFIFPAVKMASTFAIVGAIVGEFTGASEGIGFVILNASYYFDTALMFAAIACISLASIIIFFTIEWVEKKVVFWQTST